MAEPHQCGRAAPVVFLGPSAPRAAVERILPDATIAGPIERGHLHDWRAAGRHRFLIVDGAFAHALAVSPGEVVDALAGGATIDGAASMGALRAAECWPAGMRGRGVIARAFRLGCLTTDDEVAVAMDPTHRFEACSVALVNVRYATSWARRQGLLEPAARERIVAAATSTYFAERRWVSLLADAGVEDPDGSLADALASVDLKKSDTLLAARALAQCAAGAPPGVPRVASVLFPSIVGGYAARPAGPRRAGPAEPRYTGHDPLYGLDREVLDRLVGIWLLGSGRYQRYIWPVVLGTPELADAARCPVPDERAEALREGLAAVLARMCDNIDDWALTLMSELDALEELDAERARWYAVHTLADHARGDGLIPPSSIAGRVRHEVAIAHGVRDWPMLCEETSDERLFGAIPRAWVSRACEDLALARTYKASGDTTGPARGGSPAAAAAPM